MNMRKSCRTFFIVHICIVHSSMTKLDSVIELLANQFNIFRYFSLNSSACLFYFWFLFLVALNGWLAAVPPCVGFAGWLFGGMDSKPLFSAFIYLFVFQLVD